MTILILGLLIFLGVHSIVIFAPKFREKYRNSSLMSWKVIYGIISVIGFILIIIGYGEARLNPIHIYTTPFWLRHVAFALMIPFFIMFLMPYLAGPFFSKIYKFIPHPQLMSVKLWASVHLLVNGNLADLILFGAILIWAILDTIALKKLPAQNPPNTPPRFRFGILNDVILFIAGVGLYVAFLFELHGELIGMYLL